MHIVSMVANIEMELPFDLNEILTKIPNSEPCLQWVKFRFSSNNNYVAFYKKGKILISGVKSDEELHKTATSLIKYLEKMGIENRIKNIKVNNYVLMDQIDFNINLEKLTINLFEYNIDYEPEQFPGLRFKDDNNITYLLFSSGKITITGVKSLENLEEKVNSFKQLIIENI